MYDTGAVKFNKVDIAMWIKKNKMEKEFDGAYEMDKLDKIYQRKSFVKREKLDKIEDIDYSPRLIQAVSDIANVVLGPVVMGIQYTLGQIFNDGSKSKRTGKLDGQYCFASGLQALQIGEWNRDKVEIQGCNFSYDNDFSNFDGSIKMEWL